MLNARVLTERGLETGLAVRLQGDTILDVVRAEPSALGDCEPIDLGGQVLAPGFIDLQVNGGGDVLFNDAPNVATLRHIASAHRRFGTTGMLPTLISSEREVLRAAIGAVRETIAAKIAGVLGIHIEGPFIAAARKGVHDPRMFRGIDATDIGLMAAPGHGRTLVTLAPERVEPTLVAQLCQRGIIVAAGHTDASYEITRSALDAGMSGFTHLFNAMSPLQGRAPGVVGAALEDRSSWCGVIVDGQHVHPAALRSR
ncbi:N-acetylglucosamine 6-phosphate deacetylase [mine drainage metagenome]|uniref:N-acetylglucosamine 6-phosphate deacetylase n=1 Tax=mine drainage metagenome TaxID=410659 RepID=T1BY63_9ZZZZ